jgi:O-antigen ligase/polysaccharide polymerase Wzy-like membrane protein
MAWVEHGSIDAGDWLGYAALGALVLAMILFSGAAVRPSRRALIGLGFIIALAGWAALSSLWSPVPSLARDEALLTLFYAIAFAVPLLTLRSAADRLAAMTVLVAGMGSLALATAALLRFGSNTLDLFDSGRLASPISYTNAQATMYLIAFWPAIALAARRQTHIAIRSLAVGGSTAILAGWLLAQSKGAAIALVVSAIAFFAIFPARLRVLVPTLISAGLVAIVFSPLTAPYRSETDVEQLDAIRHAGTTVLWLSALGVAVGLAYVFLDRRLTVSRRLHRAAGIAALAAVVAGLVAGIAAFFITVDRPGRFFERQWRTLKHDPTGDTRTTHLLTLGSNRYDFWRVALNEFRDHPFAGDGARAFGPIYLQKRESPETPARTHSLPIEVLMEDGVLGFLLLCGAIGVPLSIVAKRARERRGPAVAAFASGVYWIVHASGDWIWTLPAAGVPFFCLLAIGASPDEESLLRRRKARPGAVVALMVALFAFMPVWISAKLTNQAAETDSATDLRWAKRLDPLSVEPYVVQATLASTPRERIPPLEDAIGKQPRSAALQFLLGEAYLEVGRRDDAIRALEEAQRLDPREPFIQRALERARGRAL